MLAGLAVSALPGTTTTLALVMGTAVGLVLGNPWPQRSSLVSRNLLQISVVGLGFGMSMKEVVQTGQSSLVFSVVGISFTLLAGYLLGRVLKVGPNTSALISAGTAICGGSAIAALAPALKAKDEETAVALATVFTLNSVALLLFPVIGHLLQLSQATFGTWAGLAIHDTSSVVGAAAAFGSQALATGTTVKLTRAIWITPVVLAVAALNGADRKLKVPLFIIGFVLAAALRSLVPQYGALWTGVAAIARQCLVVTLFLVGAGLSREVLEKVGLRPLVQGIVLWGVVSAATLTALLRLGLA
ncbi:YeiH family protein [Geomonas silvestris]|nr:putative sulfate exporter family transporter [Geomonas silvestris]